jgi:hypothetical protein
MIESERLVNTSMFVDYLHGNEIAKEWVNGFPKGELAYLEVSDSSRKSHAYRLPVNYRQFVGSLSAR